MKYFVVSVDLNMWPLTALETYNWHALSVQLFLNISRVTDTTTLMIIWCTPGRSYTCTSGQYMMFFDISPQKEANRCHTGWSRGWQNGTTLTNLRSYELLIEKFTDGCPEMWWYLILLEHISIMYLWYSTLLWHVMVHSTCHCLSMEEEWSDHFCTGYPHMFHFWPIPGMFPYITRILRSLNMIMAVNFTQDVKSSLINEPHPRGSHCHYLSEIGYLQWSHSATESNFLHFLEQQQTAYTEVAACSANGLPWTSLESFPNISNLFMCQPWSTSCTVSLETPML
jgi:hypothetical protein